MDRFELNRPLDPSECAELAAALGDRPETVIPAHLLRRGLCRAWISGSPAGYDAAIVQPTQLPTEPMGFGDNAEALFELLNASKGWECIDVLPKIAPALGTLIEKKLGGTVRYIDDVYHVLDKPVASVRHDNVRLLTLDDLQLLEAAPKELQGAGFEDARRLLTDGIVAAAIRSNEIMAIAHTSAITQRHADIGVFTRADNRGKGYATAAAALVTKAVRRTGRTAVWSCGEDNIPSLRIAHRLGFVESSRLTYVIRSHP